MKFTKTLVLCAINLMIATSIESGLIFNKIEKKDLSVVLDKVSNHPENKNIARLIASASQELEIDPKIMIAIIKVESNFDQKAISKTGDISMAQINLKVWNKEFKRLKLAKIDKVRLKADYSYSIEIMTKILKIIKNRNKNDYQWYGRYHSNTELYKSAYVKKMKIELDNMNNDIVLSKEIYAKY